MSNERDGFMVDRSIWSHEMFEDEPFTQREAWLWIIGQAAWAERKVRGPLGPITLQRGQLSHSVRFIADVWQWSKSRVDRFIDKLEKRDMVRRVSGTGQLTLSICNYEHYQLTPGFKRDTIGTASGTRAGHERDKQESRNQEITYTPYPLTQSRGFVGCADGCRGRDLDRGHRPHDGRRACQAGGEVGERHPARQAVRADGQEAAAQGQGYNHEYQTS